MARKIGPQTFGLHRCSSFIHVTVLLFSYFRGKQTLVTSEPGIALTHHRVS